MNEETSLVEVEEVQEVVPVIPLNAELDMQIGTAKKFPRSIKKFKQEALSMATSTEETAASCFYVLPRANKTIEGPSVRLAEIVANCWGNLRYGARVIGESEDRKFIIAEGFAYDLEKNVSSAITVRRKITDKYNKRYSDDIVGVTGNAACSVALRNALFKVIPMTYINEVYEEAKRLAVGDATSLSERRHKMVAHYAKFGVGVDRLLAKVGKFSLEDVGLKELGELLGIATAIKDGDAEIDSTFPKAVPEEAPKTLKDKLKNKADERTIDDEIYSVVRDHLKNSGSKKVYADSAAFIRKATGKTTGLSERDREIVLQLLPKGQTHDNP